MEWTAGSLGEIINETGVWALLLILYMTAESWGFGWMESRGLWAYVIFATALPVLILFRRAGALAAGAVWFRYRRKWVKTYELVEVKLDGAGSSTTLVLKDTDDRRLSLGLKELQSNPDLWDLVYNGILHSVHNGGAVVDERARERLRLDV